MDKISWKTYSHIHTEKTSDWYWIVGIVTVTLAIVSVLLNNVIFGVLILVGSLSLTLHASKKPKLIDVTISPKGITEDRIFYPYNNLESFHVETQDAHPRLIIKSKRLLMPLIVIFLDEADPDEIHDYLSNYLVVEELREPLLEKLLIYLGF